MSPRAFTLRSLAVAGVVLALATQSVAQIAAKSPFMPPQGATTTGPTEGAPLEYRGYMETSEGTLYRIHDPAKKAGTWVKLNVRNPDFDVLAKQHDDEQKTLTIEHQGKMLTLATREAKVVSSGAAAAAMPPPVLTPAQTSNVAPAVTQSVVLNPTPADEQRRLDAVAAEVARRRALREQATQQLNRGVAPNVTVPQSAQPQRSYQPTPPGTYQQQQTAPRTRSTQPGNVRQR
jgi:hypothetical protein